MQNLSLVDLSEIGRVLMHVLHVLIHLLLYKATEGLETELSKTNFLYNGCKLLKC